MYLPNSAHQGGNHRAFRADGTIAVTNTPQLVLPVAPFRAMLMIMNTSANTMFIEHGPARALATISNGTVSSVTITNPGFGYTIAPSIQFKGGYTDLIANASWNGLGIHNAATPTGLAQQGDSSNPQFNRPAKAHCVLSGGVVTSIVIDDPGFGYINPPEMIFENNRRDPFGCASPYFNSATSGICLPATNGFYYINGTACWTDAISISGTSGGTFVMEYMV